VRLAVVAAVALLVAGCGGRGSPIAAPSAPSTIALTSSAFADDGVIPRRYTCDGPGLSPPLRFAGLPPGTVQLALLVEDPDASGGTFVHWVAWGIDPGAAALDEGAAPPGAGTNSLGKRGYGGPCPPKGRAHRYVFTVYALSSPPELTTGATADDLRRALTGRTLAQGRLVGRYARVALFGAGAAALG
jgi:Raf kinase inhibitor-like YbhB/YbcL family protein